MNRSEHGRLAGKTALVTGAAGGIGSAIARAFAEEGARVLLTDRNEAAVRAVAGAITADHGADSARCCAHDVTSESDWAAAVALVRAEFGGLSVLVNNAGIGKGAPIPLTSLEHWRQVMAVNAEGPLLGCKAALPLLVESGPAAIIQIASIAGVIGAPGLGAYAASKAALISLTRTLALECTQAGWDVRCNAILPAFVDTPLLDGFVRPGATREAVDSALSAQLPARRLGTAREIALAAVYLGSDESRFMTGAELRLDGGLTAQ